MGSLDRYKKGYGIMDLVKLIEDSPDAKRNQLIEMVRNEDPDFCRRVLSRVLSWDVIKAFAEGVLAEVISSTPAKYVALALYGETKELITTCEKCLGKGYNEYKQEKDTFAATPPTPGAVEAARRKIVAQARKLESDGRVKINYVEIAPEGGAGSGEALKGLGGNQASGAATEGGGCPPIESFGLEPPPPGLIGERFVVFVKGNLGV